MAVMSLEEMSAKQEITELLYRYCRGIDRLDWDLVRSCYHDDAFDDHSIFRGSPDEFVAFFAAATASENVAMIPSAKALTTEPL